MKKNVAQKDIIGYSIIVPIDQVVAWSKNPREVRDEDIERLKKQLLKFKQYKPMLCYKNGKKYVALGGNMRLRALRELHIKHVWINVVDPKSETEKIELSLSDNDRVGYYKHDLLAPMLQEHELNKLMFKVDMSIPKITLAHVLNSLDVPTKDATQIKKTHEVIIECYNEQEQKDVYEKLVKEGYKCRVLTF